MAHLPAPASVASCAAELIFCHLHAGGHSAARVFRRTLPNSPAETPGAAVATGPGTEVRVAADVALSGPSTAGSVWHSPKPRPSGCCFLWRRHVAM